jgi:hypothetical protein
MKVLTCAVVMALATATAAYAADQGTASPTKSTPGSGQTMQQKSTAPAKQRAAAATKPTRTHSQNQAEDKITAELNQQQLAGNGMAGTSRPSMTPQSAQNPNNCSPSMKDCAPSADGPAQSGDAMTPR